MLIATRERLVCIVETLVVVTTSGSFRESFSLHPAISILLHRGRSVLDDGHWMLRHSWPKPGQMIRQIVVFRGVFPIRKSEEMKGLS